MKHIDTAFAGLTARCCNPSDGCACCDTERVLRGYAYGQAGPLPAMSEAQRIACLDEILAYEEGSERADWEGSTDAQLASGVLSAWQGYCQSLGMI